MNRFQMLRVFVLITLRGREVPLQDLVCEYGMETELQEMILELERRLNRRQDESAMWFSEWSRYLTTVRRVDDCPDIDSLQYSEDETMEVYDGPADVQERFDRSNMRKRRLFRCLVTLRQILDPVEADQIPF